MDRIQLAGVLLFLVGMAGYIAGIYVTYPGRSFSVTAVMVGLSLVVIGQGQQTGENR